MRREGALTRLRPARAAGLALLLVALPGGAQGAEPAAVAVEVRGRRPVAPRDNVRTRELFEAGTHRTGSDLMRTLPGVFVTQHSGEGKAHQIFFRGFDALHGQDLEVSVADVPVNEVSNVHGQGYADLHFVIPEVVERVVALPGALDASQGDFAVAGSLRYELGYPYDGVTTKLGVGSFGTKRLFLGYHPEGRPAEDFVAAELYESQGAGEARGAGRSSAMLQWTEPLARGMDVRVLASSYAARFESPGVLRQSDIDQGLVDRLGSYDPEQGGTSTRSQLAMSLTRGFEETKFDATAYLVLRSLSLSSNYTGQLVNEETGDRTVQLNDSVTFGFSTRFERAIEVISEQDSLSAGISARRDDIDQRQSTTALEPTVDAGVHAVGIGAYLDLGLRPLERVVLHAALRADGLAFDVDDRVARVTRTSRGQHWGPKLTLDVLLTPTVVAFAGYGNGFRSPQARSLGNGERTPFTEAHTAELGLRYRERNRFSAQLVGFGSTLDDDLVFDETTSRNEPVPGTRRLGVAADITSRGAHGFVSGCGASYSKATFEASDERYQQGETVPYVPAWVVRCDVGTRPRVATVGKHPLYAHLGSSLGALLDRPLPFGERGSDVLVFDALAGLAYSDVEFELSVQNVLHSAWNDGEFVYSSAFPDVPATLVPQRHVTAGTPRSVMATLTLHLGG